MKQGKRYLRNTVFALYGTVAAFVGLSRLHASAIDTDTPQWQRSLLSVGLRVAPEPRTQKETLAVELASLRNFTELRLNGDFNVDIVGAAEYKVTFEPAADKPSAIQAFSEGSTVRLTGFGTRGGTGRATLRIETPTLTLIRASNLPSLSVRGLHAQRLELIATSIHTVRLQENQISRSSIRSIGGTTELQVDEASLAAGSMEMAGRVVISRVE